MELETNPWSQKKEERTPQVSFKEEQNKADNRRFSELKVGDGDKLWYSPDLLEDASKGVIRKQVLVSIVCVIFITVEVIGGLLANSLAILSDAAHLLSDLLGFGFSIIAVQLAKKKATTSLTYGYHRAEIIGALASTFLIIVLTGVLLYTAIIRILHPPTRFQPDFMLYTAIFGLICNLIMVQVLHSGGHGHGVGKKCDHDHGDGKKEDHGHDHGHNHAHDDNKKCNDDHGHAHDDHGHAHDDKKKCNDDHGHAHDDHGHAHDDKKKCNDNHGHAHDDHGHAHDDHGHAHDDKDPIIEKNLSKISANENANIRAAFIHILGDILQSVGVVMAAIVIKIKPEWHIIDPICTIVFAIIVAFTTTNVIGSCIYLLMESVPEDLNQEEFEEAQMTIHGVEDVHDQHVWSLTEGKPAMTAHIRGNNVDYILKKATVICRKYGIYHSTIQVEREEQSAKASKFYIDCGQNIH